VLKKGNMALGSIESNKKASLPSNENQQPGSQFLDKVIVYLQIYFKNMADIPAQPQLPHERHIERFNTTLDRQFPGSKRYQPKN